MFGFFYTFGVNYNDHSELEQKLDTGVIVARSLTLSIFGQYIGLLEYQLI